MAMALQLGAVRPNPSGGLAILPYSLRTGGDVTAAVYNLSGQLVRLAHLGLVPAGNHELLWDTRTCAIGTYFWRVSCGGHSAAKSVVVTR